MAAEQTPRPASLDELLKERQEMEALHQRPPLSFWQLAGRRLVRDRLTMAAMFVLFTILVLSVGGEWISSTLLGVDPYDTDLLRSLEPPSWDHLLGTNVNGQDQFARILVAGRISLAIGFFGAFFTLVIAITLGMITAYFGGFVDDLIMWVINTLESIPALFLLLLVGSLFDLSPAWLTIIFALLGWPTITRLVRSSVFSLRERDFVIASRSIGSRSAAIMVRHILPNVIPIVIIATARRVGVLMLSEAALSYLGFGVQPPTVTWGSMLTKAQTLILRPDARFLIWAPGIMITVSVLCIFIIGDGIRDALDPRLKQ